MSDVVERYFEAFNAGDRQGMLDCVTDDVMHYVNQAPVRRGKRLFSEFCAHMSDCYEETLTDIEIMRTGNGAVTAAEYVVCGKYIATDEGLPEAQGQRYYLPAGSFFTLRGDRIARVTTYYNLSDWIRQVS